MVPNEWMELCNNGEEDVDVSGWLVQSAEPPFADQYEIPSGTVIPTGGYLLLGPGTFNNSFQNGGRQPMVYVFWILHLDGPTHCCMMHQMAMV